MSKGMRKGNPFIMVSVLFIFEGAVIYLFNRFLPLNLPLTLIAGTALTLGVALAFRGLARENGYYGNYCELIQLIAAEAELLVDELLATLARGEAEVAILSHLSADGPLYAEARRRPRDGTENRARDR